MLSLVALVVVSALPAPEAKAPGAARVGWAAGDRAFVVVEWVLDDETSKLALLAHAHAAGIDDGKVCDAKDPACAWTSLAALRPTSGLRLDGRRVLVGNRQVGALTDPDDFVPALVAAFESPDRTQLLVRYRLALEGEPVPAVMTAVFGFSIALLRGARTDKGTAAEGMTKVVTGPVSQVLYWTVPTGTLRARADHERALVTRAGATLDPIADRSGALTWTARADRTHFASTLTDCGTHHVLLTTMGADEALVRETEATTRKTLRCAR